MSRAQNFVVGESIEPSGSPSETQGGAIEKPAGQSDTTAASSDKALELNDPSLFVNRELSWLSFNRRVLDQCFDTTWPLLERVKFLAIHGSNLDEFFMVRVPGLHDQVESGVTDTAPDGMTAREQLDAIRVEVMRQMEAVADALETQLLPALQAAGITLRGWGELTPEQQEKGRAYFRRAVLPVLTPLAVDPLHPFPFLSNLSLSLAVEVKDPRSNERHFARVKVPESLPRFIAVDSFDKPEHGPVSGQPFAAIALEELIGHNARELFPGAEVIGWHVFRVTRDMDLDIFEEEAADLLQAVDREVRRRRFGAAVRLELTRGLPDHIRGLLLEKLEIDAGDVYELRGLLGVSALMELCRLPRPELKDPPLVSRVPTRWLSGSDPFAIIRAGDVLLHHPYDSFRPVLDFLERAANDPEVLALKMTLYRAGSNAEAVRMLIRAAENGKQVAVSIELKARFDEENNITWARALERAGAHVFYGAAGLKTHAKVILAVRREGVTLRRYVHLSTGNYNSTTANFYTDFGLLTCDPEIGEDATQLFNSLSGFSVAPEYKALSVAPLSLRTALLDKIGAQAQRAKQGKPARIFAKLNSLVDLQVIRALYRASQAGVDIELVIRGICCLRAGVPGVSERIVVRSLIGRFLEHERVFVLGPAGEEECFLASADWMPRNLDRRVEALFPVAQDSARRQIVAECLEPLRLDNCRIYEMNADGSYTRRQPGDHHLLDAQAHTAWCVGMHRSHTYSSPPPQVSLKEPLN